MREQASGNKRRNKERKEWRTHRNNSQRLARIESRRKGKKHISKKESEVVDLIPVLARYKVFLRIFPGDMLMAWPGDHVPSPPTEKKYLRQPAFPEIEIIKKTI